MSKFYVTYLLENEEPLKLTAFDTRTNYESGEQALEFLVSLNHKRVWVNALDCVVITKGAYDSVEVV